MEIIKQAEEKVINLCKEMDDMISICDALICAGNKFFEREDMRADYFKGLSLMRGAIFNKYQESLARCFVLSGVGGDKASEYSRETFKKMFKGNETLVF